MCRASGSPKTTVFPLPCRPERSSHTRLHRATGAEAANPLRTWCSRGGLPSSPRLSADKLWCFAIPLSNYRPCSLRRPGLPRAAGSAATWGLSDGGVEVMGGTGVQSGEVSRCSHLTDVFCRSPWSRPHGWGLSDLAERHKHGLSVGPLLEKSSLLAGG